MKLRLPAKLHASLLSTFIFLTVSSGSLSDAAEGFSINFYATGTAAGANAALSGEGEAGVLPVAGDHWTNVNNTNLTGVLKNNAGSALSGVSVQSSKNTWGPSGNTPAPTTPNGNLLASYVDVSTTDSYTVKIAGSPYLVSTVYLIMGGDGVAGGTAAADKFTAMSVNGVSYMGSGTDTVEGIGVWGDRGKGQSELVEGKNFLVVNGVAGGNIEIGNVLNGSGRGSISGVQVENAYEGTKRDLILTASGLWTGLGSLVPWSILDGGTGWVDSTADAGSYASIVSTLPVVGGLLGNTLTIGEGVDNAVTTDAVVLASGSTGNLTISGGTLNLVGPAILRADGADRTLTISSALSSSGNVTIDGVGTISFGANQTISGLSGIGKLDIGATTLTVGGAGDGVFGGVLSSLAGASLIKTGAGNQSLSNVGQFAGSNITIQEGALTIGLASSRLDSFNKNVVAGEGATLSLWMGTSAEGAGAGPIILGNDFAGKLVLQTGSVFALNVNNAQQTANIGMGKLHLSNGTTFLIRNGINNANDSVFSNDIFLSKGGVILRSYGSATSVISSDINGDGVDGLTENGLDNWLRRTDGGTITLSGNIDYKGRVQLEGGTTNFKGALNLGVLYMGTAIANLEDGANATIGALRLTEGNSTSSTLNIKTGSTLTITGTNNTDTQWASFLLNHWPGSSQFNVMGGTVNAGQLIMKTAWDGTSTTTVTAGSLNVKGIAFGGKVLLGTNAAGTVSDETATGRINIGDVGITHLVNSSASAQLVLGRGTLGALANWNTNATNGGKKITLLSALGTIFDTQSMTDPLVGYAITINHSLTGAGKIVKNGLGSLVLNGTESDFTGGVELNKGTLSVVTSAMGAVGSRKLHVSGTGTGEATPMLVVRDGSLSLDVLTIADGGRLNFGGDATNILSVASSVSLSNAALVFSYGDLLHVAGDLTATGALSFEMSLAGYVAGDEIILGSVTGNISNLLFANSLASTDYRSATATVSKKENNLVATVAGGAATLTWTEANTVWGLKTGADWQGGDDQMFWQGDNVIFGDTSAGSSSVQISGAVLPGKMTLTNDSTAYLFSGGSITVTNAFSKTGTGLWTLGAGSSLILQGGFATTADTLGFDGGSLDISAISESDPVNFGVLQKVADGSTLNFGSKKVILGVKEAGSFSHMTLVGTGSLMAAGTNALDISGVTSNLYAGTGGLNITGNTVTPAVNLGIYGGSWDAQASASGGITIGAATGETILDFGTGIVTNTAGIFGAASNLGNGVGIEDTSVIADIMTNISLIGTLTGTGDSMTSNTKITGKIYGGGIESANIYGSTQLTMDGIHLVGGTNDALSLGTALLVVGSTFNSTIYGNASLEVRSSLIDSIIFGTGGTVTGDVNLSFENSVVKKNVYAGGYGGGSLIKGGVNFSAENTTFSTNVYGGRDGIVNGKISMELTNSSVLGNLFGGYSVAGDNKVMGGVDIVLDGSNVTGMLGIGAGGSSETSGIVNGASTITIKGDSRVGLLWGAGSRYSTVSGNVLIDIQGGIIGEGKVGSELDAFLISGRDGKIDGNATLKVSGTASIRNEYIVFGGFGGTGIVGNARLEVTGGTVESNIMGAGSWNNKIGGNFDMVFSGGTFGKEGTLRGITGGTKTGLNNIDPKLVLGNVSITLDGGISGLGSTFLGGADGSKYYIYAGSVANNIGGNTLVTLSNISQKAADGLVGVANFKGVISGANATGGGVLGTERKLVFDNYKTEVNAQFKYFTIAEVGNGSNLTLKGTSSSIGGWSVKGASTLNLDSLARLGGATTLNIDDNLSFVNLALAEDASLTGSFLSGSGTLVLSGAHVLTVSGDNSAFNGVLRIDSGTLSIGDNGIAGSANSTINLNGGALDIVGASKTLNQKVAGDGALKLNLTTADAEATLSNTGSTFAGSMTLTKGVLDVAAGSAMSGVSATLASDSSMKLHDSDLSRFSSISGAGNLIIDGNTSHEGDTMLSQLTGSLSVADSKTFTLTKNSDSSVVTLNAGVTINLANESSLTLVNGSGALWEQTVKDVINSTGGANVTLSGASGVTLRIAGDNWKDSSGLNFTLSDEDLFKVFVDVKYASDMFTNVTLTDGNGVNNVVVDVDGRLLAFTNYIELPVANGSSYTSNGYYIVSGALGSDGLTVVDPSIATIGIRGLKISSSSAAELPDKHKNTSLDLGGSELSLGSGSLLFDGDSDYLISGGTILGSDTNGLSVNTAAKQLTISSIVGKAGSSLNKDGVGRLNLNNTLNASTVSVNAGALALSELAVASGAAMTVKKDASLILGNESKASYQSGLASVSNSGTVTLLEGASLGNSIAFENNGTFNYNIGEGKTMDQSLLTGTGKLVVESGLLNVGTASLSVGQSYQVKEDASLAFDTGNGAAFASALSGSGHVSYKGGSLQNMQMNVSQFDGTFTLTSSENPYRLEFRGANSFAEGTSIVVGNNAQFWDSFDVANVRNYDFVLTGSGHEGRGALRVANGATYGGTIIIDGVSAGIGGAAGDSITINSTISSRTDGILYLGATGDTNGLGTVTLSGNNIGLEGTMLWAVTKVIANSAHALGGKLELSSANAGTQALEFNANVELESLTGFIAGKTLGLMTEASGLTLTGADASNLAGTISGKGGLTLKGPGEVSLSGNNTYEGGTNIEGSQVVLSTNISALGSSGVMLNSGSLNAGGLAVTNAISVKTGGSLSGMSAYAGALSIAMSKVAAAGNTVNVSGALSANTITLADSHSRVSVDGNVTISNGGSFALDMNNVYDVATNPGAIIQSTGTVAINGEFTLTFNTNLKGGENEFKLFSGAFATGNTATAQLLYNDEYLKTFFTMDASRLNSTGSIFINRNTPDAFFVNQADVDAMAGGYVAKVDTALGANSAGTADAPVNFNKDYQLADDSYRFTNGEGWLNVQTRLEGAGNKVVIFDYIPENGADPVTDDRGIIFSNNENTFGGGMMVNNARVIVDGSLSADQAGRPVAGGKVNILGTGQVALGGNEAVLELRPLGEGNTDSFTIGNDISLRDGATIEQTGGENTLAGLISVVSGSVVLSNQTAQDMIIAGELAASAGTTLNMDGKIVLDDGILSANIVTLNGGSEFVLRNAADAKINTLNGADGTVSVMDNSKLSLLGATHVIGSLTGSGTLTLNSGSLELGAGNTLDSTIAGKGMLKLAGGTTLTMGSSGRIGEGVVLDLTYDNTLDLAGNTSHVGGVTGAGTVNMNGGTLVITGASSEFKGDFAGAGTLEQSSSNVLTLASAGSSDVNLKVNSGEIIINSPAGAAAVSYGDVAATKGSLTVTSDATFKSLSMGSDGSLTLGSTVLDSGKKPISLTVEGNASFARGANINCIIPSGAPQLSATGTIQLSNQMNINLVDNMSAQIDSPPATFILMQADGGFIDDASAAWADGTRFTDWNVSIKGALSLFYSTGAAYVDGNMLKADSVKNISNVLDGVAQSSVARAGSELLWRAGMHEEGTTLRDLLDSVMNDVDAGNNISASRSMAAAAGSTITSLSASQKEGFRQQQLAIRNRTSQMGVNQDYVNEDMPYFNMWMQGNGGYNKLDTQGDESGYTLSTWGGSVGFDVDLNEHLTVGSAFTASYGKLKASAADTAKGDSDAYYVNLFARAQFKKWSHTLILTGGWNDASLNRTVGFNGGSYTGRGNTTGAGYGAMYEVAYDIVLNDKKTSILQPLFNASIVSTKMNGYDESGAGNAGLHVDNMEMTTGTLAAGARWMGFVGNNLFGRDALGEVRLNIAQDVGDKKGSANVGFIGNPGFMQTVKGSKIGMTGIQAGIGLSLPVGQKGSIYVDGSTDFRSGATTVNGTLGYRYNF